MLALKRCASQRIDPFPDCATASDCMSIPDYQALMLPLLRFAADGKEHRFREAVVHLAREFNVSDEEQKELLPSGTAPVFDNRVGWARTYLKQAGLLDSPKRGLFRISEQGKALLNENPAHVDVSFLDRYDEFRAFRTRRRGKPLASIKRSLELEQDTDKTPEDALAAAYIKLRNNLEAELLEQVKQASSLFFERLVVDLLVKMGYGGSRQDAGRAVGQTGDGGIDGVINEDKLGLDVIYIQAKRWDSVVGRPEIQKFAGALQDQRVHKGVFITTSAFTKDAKDYAGIINSKLILIDGRRMASLMVDYNVGVSPVGMYELKRVDHDYFEGE